MRHKMLFRLLLISAMWTASVQARGRIIVRVGGGLPVVQVACAIAGCTVAENIDGAPAAVYLVTTPDSANPNSVLAALLNISGVLNAEIDTLAHVESSGTPIPPALSDTAPITYYGAQVINGYVHQPATQIVRLPDMQTGFPSDTGARIVAVIDTGVDPNHPALRNVLMTGYDFTRNRNGADETLDVTLPAPPIIEGSQPQWVNGGSGSGDVSQSTAAVINQSTASVINGNSQYSDFGHGTMVAGIIHLVAPTARILPLKAFRADGTGYNSDILRAIYRAIQLNAKVINMSFSLAAYSQEVANALNIGSLVGTISVASAGNSGENALVYPAALQNVIGVASTANDDQLSTFSNYGSQLVWIGAPGEAIITTYPFSTYAAGWGTSFSAPFASGVAAVLSGMNLVCDQYSTSDSLAHAKWDGPDVNHGRLDIYQAVQYWSGAIGSH